MERRRFLATTGVSFLIPFAGCSDATSDNNGDNMGSETPSNEKPNLEIRFKEQEGDTGNPVRERIIIRNKSDHSIGIGGYTLRYSSGYEYTFSGGFSLEPYSKVAVVSQGEGDGTAESDPPTYYRDADLPELILEDGEEAVRLLNREEGLIIKEVYNSD